MWCQSTSALIIVNHRMGLGWKVGLLGDRMMAFISTYCKLILAFEFCGSHNVFVKGGISTVQLQVTALICVRTFRVALYNLAVVKN